jgi:hypothetical protein
MLSITVPKGIRKLDELMILVDADEIIPTQIGLLDKRLTI